MFFNPFFSSQGSSGQSSLLGEPPKEVRLPSNPYLNLASVMPGVVLQGDYSKNGKQTLTFGLLLM